MGRNGCNSATQALSISLGSIFLPLPVPEIAKTGLDFNGGYLLIFSL